MMERINELMEHIPLIPVAVVVGIVIIAGIGITIYDLFNKDVSE